MTDIFAKPLNVTTPNDCYFYHTIEVPQYGVFEGAWDLRHKVGAYLGGLDFKGKRVLEVGTANGFLCFEMEKRGAEVIGYDLSPEHDWDIVPFYGNNQNLLKKKDNIRRLNRAWWFAHKAFNSKARLVHGTVYTIPKEIGPVHISTFGSILLHLRDPLLALKKAADLTTETIVITDLDPEGFFPKSWKQRLAERFTRKTSPRAYFLPNASAEQSDTWWLLEPQLLREYLKILGFPHLSVSYHTQTFKQNNQLKLFTIVGRR